MLYHTVNKTTTQNGQSLATIVADSTANGNRITTFELLYPRYIHSEVMTYRMWSRNASSSRATPLNVTLSEVRNDPVFFDKVGKNKSGMVAGALLGTNELVEFEKDWYELANLVADKIEEFQAKYNIHKQVLNRALEPFSRIKTLVTATDFENFFKQRLADDAQPEIYNLALSMKEAMAESTPIETKEHLPYLTENEKDLEHEIQREICVARCARVSYGRHDQKLSSVDDDVALFGRLYHSMHLSPFEHVATALEYKNRHKYNANLKGWCSMRHEMGY